ncbi:Adenosylcobinamide-phosphate guanylyltransferase [Candidatus Rhodobacter oscarellae]|uniref:Bifunctional adenosylcobalamin biosynthesis protein n=1 Tax=Candidatus Rhodobacter oscarellae TaxID=1675527 RepID=A0A0J9E885_9RHOB|nr:Adenosylcobinamide-phosphate guanylyltransferase [Candidatus Rhodobacter lobularis]
MRPKRIFVLGGARSGKSRFAEALLGETGKPRVYIATAQAFDGEMKHRIAQHKADRGADWRTVEAPLEVASALGEVSAQEAVLLDCATLWLSNQLLAEADLSGQSDALLAALEACAGEVVVVSNEVGQGIVPENALARRFRDAQGRLNQRLAAWADCAVLVAAGLPLVLKGSLE